jgi:hypothetical protein
MGVKMKLLTIEVVIDDEMADKYMSLPIGQRAGYIQEMERQGKFKLNNFTTELEGEFEDDNEEEVVI